MIPNDNSRFLIFYNYVTHFLKKKKKNLTRIILGHELTDMRAQAGTQRSRTALAKAADKWLSDCTFLCLLDLLFISMNV